MGGLLGIVEIFSGMRKEDSFTVPLTPLDI